MRLPVGAEFDVNGTVEWSWGDRILAEPEPGADTTMADA